MIQGDYNAVLLEIATAAGNTDEESTANVLIMAATIITRLHDELQRAEKLNQSMGSTLVDVAYALDKHKKIVKEIREQQTIRQHVKP